MFITVGKYIPLRKLNVSDKQFQDLKLGTRYIYCIL